MSFKSDFIVIIFKNIQFEQKNDNPDIISHKWIFMCYTTITRSGTEGGQRNERKTFCCC